MNFELGTPFPFSRCQQSLNEGIQYMRKWKKISSQVIFEHSRLTLIEDEVMLPDGKVISYLRSSFPRSAAVTVIAVKDDCVLLSQEYSYPPDEVLYQFPGGGVNVGESPAAAANRELVEETGHTAKFFRPLGWYYIDNRRTDARMYVFLATGIIACDKQGGDIEEFIESSWVSIKSIPDLITKGKLPNFSLLAAWALFEAATKSKEG